MIVLAVLLCIILISISYLFFAPFFFEIDSAKKIYRFRFHHLASAYIKMSGNSLALEIKIMGWKKEIDLFAARKTSKAKPVEKKTWRAKRRHIKRSKIKAVIGSFKISKCYVSLCFDDMQLNGILYPVFYLLSFYSRKPIGINFIEENRIVLEIKNNLARMSWAYIRS
ncbi:MAG: hypothetical protein ACLQQ4_09410 [Bacteroidia bacterium]